MIRFLAAGQCISSYTTFQTTKSPLRFHSVLHRACENH